MDEILSILVIVLFSAVFILCRDIKKLRKEVDDRINFMCNNFAKMERRIMDALEKEHKND